MFHHGELNAKVGHQEISGFTGKFDLTEFCQENALVIANTLFQQHKRRLSPDIKINSVQIQLEKKY